MEGFNFVFLACVIIIIIMRKDMFMDATHTFQNMFVNKTSMHNMVKT